MSSVAQGLRGYFQGWSLGWNQFWFRPVDPATYALIRILTGAMLFYTHLVWSLELQAFFFRDGLLSEEYVKTLFADSPFAWSHFFWIGDTSLLWVCHIAALAVFACFTLGLLTRVTGILSFLFLVSYAHRASGALFGLDQINGFLTLYLAIGPAGACFSLDRWLRRRRGPNAAVRPSIGAALCIRLMQVHLCVVYLFAGLGKLLGQRWWSGEALWGAMASYDYQTLDMTWLAHAPLLINVLTITTLAWEISYGFLVWPRLTRPIMVAIAVIVHLGIGFCMGMITFGLIMVVANLAFVSPALVRALPRTFGRRQG